PGQGAHEARRPRLGLRRLRRAARGDELVREGGGLAAAGQRRRHPALEHLRADPDEPPEPAGGSAGALGAAARIGQGRTSAISAKALRSGSRKKAIHRSWSGIFAMRWGFASTVTLRADKASKAAWMSATL